MMTMLNVLILDEWSSIIWPVYWQQTPLVFFFIGFLMFTTFGMMNVVVGIVTEQALLMSEKQRSRDEEKFRRARMRKIIVLADDLFKSTDELSSHELQRVASMQSRKSDMLMEELKAVKFPRGFHIGDVHLMFDDEFNKSISKDEFINGMFRLVFNDPFQRDCCLSLQIARLREQVHSGLASVLQELEALRASPTKEPVAEPERAEPPPIQGKAESKPVERAPARPALNGSAKGETDAATLKAISTRLEEVVARVRGMESAQTRTAEKLERQAAQQGELFEGLTQAIDGRLERQAALQGALAGLAQKLEGRLQAGSGALEQVSAPASSEAPDLVLPLLKETGDTVAEVEVGRHPAETPRGQKLMGPRRGANTRAGASSQAWEIQARPVTPERQ